MQENGEAHDFDFHLAGFGQSLKGAGVMSLAQPMPRTEAVHERAHGLDIRADAEILQTLLVGQRRAVDSVAAAIPQLSRAAELGAAALRGHGRLIYLASGSPALTAARAAGCATIAVTHTYPRGRLDAHVIVDSLDEIDSATLSTALSSPR